MKVCQEIWMSRLSKLIDDPDTIQIALVCQDILADDTGHTDGLVRILAKHLQKQIEIQNFLIRLMKEENA